MPPRPHLVFRGKLGLLDLVSVTRLGAGTLTGSGAQGHPGTKRTDSVPPAISKDRATLAAILAAEVVIFVALIVLIAGETMDPRDSSWSLFAVSLFLVFLSCLRRMLFPESAAE